jgi:hypothetical protein
LPAASFRFLGKATTNAIVLGEEHPQKVVGSIETRILTHLKTIYMILMAFGSTFNLKSTKSIRFVKAQRKLFEESEAYNVDIVG